MGFDRGRRGRRLVLRRRDPDSGGWINPNDQGWHQLAWSAQPVLMTLDSRGDLCQTCSGCALEEFDLTGPRIKNVATGTEPLVWHFNGGSKNDLMPLFLKKLGLA